MMDGRVIIQRDMYLMILLSLVSAFPSDLSLLGCHPLVYITICCRIQMQLDWITLYDYMAIFSRSQIKSKINKFYESFYPLKFKKTGKKTCSLMPIERVGLLGIVATYIQQTLFALESYLQAQYFLCRGKIKDDVKLSRMFVEIEKKNLEVSLEIEKLVYIIVEASKAYNNTHDDRGKEKSFLEIKIICSLIRLFEFFYSLHEMRKDLSPDGFEKIENCLRLFAIKVCEKSKEHIKLYPEIGEVLVEILNFFMTEEKAPFNFHSHLSDDSQGKKRSFPERLKKLVAVIPNKQKNVLVNLNDEGFYDYLLKSKLNIPKQPVENYFRCEEEINSLIAEEENFIESILISEKYRGTREWKEKVMEQLINLSVEKKMTNSSRLLEYKNFRLSEDFPLNLT